MARKPKFETKRVRLALNTNRGAKELVKLQEDGWEIVSQHKRGLMQFSPGQVDFVLKRTNDKPEPEAAPTPSAEASPPPSAPMGPPAGWYNDPHGAQGLRRWWDGTQWTDHTQAG